MATRMIGIKTLFKLTSGEWAIYKYPLWLNGIILLTRRQ